MGIIPHQEFPVNILIPFRQCFCVFLFIISCGKGAVIDLISVCIRIDSTQV